MRKVLTITALLMAALLVFSCANGGGSDSDNSPVKVSFNVETPHEDIAKIAVVNNSTATYDFWYAAIPQWTGVDFTTIQGATGGTNAEPTYKKIDGYVAGSEKSLGLFAQGSWKFYVLVKKHSAGTINDVTVYEGSTDVVYINSNTNLTIDVTRKADAGTATVSVDIEVPKYSLGDTDLTVAYSGAGNGEIDLGDTATPTKTGEWVRFTGTSSALDAGSYLFTLTSKNNSAAVGGAVLAFDIIPGENRTITGTIENGVWQTTLITINVPTLSVVLSGAESVAKNASTNFTCSATSANLADGDVVKFEWFVDTASKGAAAAGTEDPEVAGKYISTYSFSHANPGQYYVTCKASVGGKLIASKTAKVTVTN